MTAQQIDEIIDKSNQHFSDYREAIDIINNNSEIQNRNWEIQKNINIDIESVLNELS